MYIFFVMSLFKGMYEVWLYFFSFTFIPQKRQRESSVMTLRSPLAPRFLRLWVYVLQRLKVSLINKRLKI